MGVKKSRLFRIKSLPIHCARIDQSRYHQLNDDVEGQEQYTSSCIPDTFIERVIINILSIIFSADS
jgi:hypothetical protein